MVDEDTLDQALKVDHRGYVIIPAAVVPIVAVRILADAKILKKSIDVVAGDFITKGIYRHSNEKRREDNNR